MKYFYEQKLTWGRGSSGVRTIGPRAEMINTEENFK